MQSLNVIVFDKLVLRFLIVVIIILSYSVLQLSSIPH